MTEPGTEPNEPARKSRAELQAEIKAGLLGKFGKRAGRKKKAAKEPATKLIEYDLMPVEEQDKYFGADGRCLFLEMTGESVYPQVVVDRAFDMYLSWITMEAIGVRFDIPVSTIARWAKTNAWQKKADKFKQAVEDERNKSKVKATVSKRQKIDEKHEGIINWLQSEIKWEMDARPKAGVDERGEIIFENRKNMRMKTLKIAVDCFKALIETEREIMGIDNAVPEQQKAPTDFKFVIETKDGFSFDTAALAAALPDQNPHEYLPGVANAPLALPAMGATGERLPAQPNAALDPIVVALDAASEQNAAAPQGHGGGTKAIDPIVIAQQGAFDNKQAESKPKPHPVFGFLPFGDTY